VCVCVCVCVCADLCACDMAEQVGAPSLALCRVFICLELTSSEDLTGICDVGQGARAHVGRADGARQEPLPRAR
jgi:hypothetical protein